MTTELVTLEQQIACLKREIAMRKNVYPKWVKAGRMKQEDAEREIAAMTAALHTVMAVQDGSIERTAVSGVLDQALNSGDGSYRP